MLPNPPERSGRPGKGLNQGLQYAVLGTEISLTVAAAAWFGWWLDEKFDTEPWLLLVMVLLGTGAAMLRLFRLARFLARTAEREEAEAKDHDEEAGGGKE